MIVVNILIILTTVGTSDEYVEADLCYNDPRFLPDGLIVVGGSDTKRFVANWQVLITIATPTEISGLRQKLARLKMILNNLRSVHEVANATSLPNLQCTGERRRLLDVFGELQKALFGTATDSDVRECKRQLRLFGKVNQHSVSEMISIVNSTHDQVLQHRQHIHALQHYIEKVSDQINIIEGLWLRQVAKFERQNIVRAGISHRRFNSQTGITAYRDLQ